MHSNTPSDPYADEGGSHSVEPGLSDNALDAGIDLDTIDVSGPLLTPMNELSLHVLAQKAAIASWSKLRPDMLKTAIDCNAMPLKQKCILYSTDDVAYRYLKCAPMGLFLPSVFWRCS